MDRKSLEEKGLGAEAIDFVMSENGKDIAAEKAKADAEKAKAERAQNDKIAEYEKQIEGYKETISKESSLSEETKAKIANLEKEHEKAIKEKQEEIEQARADADAAIAKTSREAAITNFFASYGKKMANRETQAYWAAELDKAMQDAANAGKSLKEIFEGSAKDEGGSLRGDIFAQPAPEILKTNLPNALAGTGQGGAKQPESLLSALQEKYSR